jgi:hypothetical protein
MPEILDAYERDGKFFGVVCIDIKGAMRAFEFGVDLSGYKALRRVLQAWPYEARNVAPYHYFLFGEFSKDPSHGKFSFTVRIEQESEARNFSFVGPETFVTNLKWFYDLHINSPFDLNNPAYGTDPSEVTKHLTVVHTSGHMAQSKPH